MSKTKQHTFRAPLRSHPMPLLFNYLTIHRFKGNSGTTPWRLGDGFWDDLNLQNHSVLPSLGRRDGSKGSKGIAPPSDRFNFVQWVVSRFAPAFASPHGRGLG